MSDERLPQFDEMPTPIKEIIDLCNLPGIAHFKTREGIYWFTTSLNVWNLVEVGSAFMDVQDGNIVGLLEVIAMEGERGGEEILLSNGEHLTAEQWADRGVITGFDSREKTDQQSREWGFKPDTWEPRKPKQTTGNAESGSSPTD